MNITTSEKYLNDLTCTSRAKIVSIFEINLLNNSIKRDFDKLKYLYYKNL